MKFFINIKFKDTLSFLISHPGCQIKAASTAIDDIMHSEFELDSQPEKNELINFLKNYHISFSEIKDLTNKTAQSLKTEESRRLAIPELAIRLDPECSLVWTTLEENEIQTTATCKFSFYIKLIQIDPFRKNDGNKLTHFYSVGEINFQLYNADKDYQKPHYIIDAIIASNDKLLSRIECNKKYIKIIRRILEGAEAEDQYEKPSIAVIKNCTPVIDKILSCLELDCRKYATEKITQTMIKNANTVLEIDDYNQRWKVFDNKQLF